MSKREELRRQLMDCQNAIKRTNENITAAVLAGDIEVYMKETEARAKYVMRARGLNELICRCECR